MDFIAQLSLLYQENSNSESASAMKAYMRHKFEFFGIKASLRRTLLNEVIRSCKEEVSQNPQAIAKQLYNLPQREFHLCAMEIFEKELRKKYVREDISNIENLITLNSWWDTVDYIAKNILGRYLLLFPEETNTVISKYTETSDIWLNRSTIIFQLGYKIKTNEAILFTQCEHFRHSNEFFIRKAIGWALREYGKTNPESVLNFVHSTQLKPLSQKEAIRNIIK